MDHKIPDNLDKIPFYCDIYANINDSIQNRMTNIINSFDDLFNFEKEKNYSDKNKWINEKNYKIMNFNSGIELDLEKTMHYITELHRLNNILTQNKEFYKNENNIEENIGYTFRITDKTNKKICHSCSTTKSMYAILIKIVKCMELEKGRTSLDQIIIDNKTNISNLSISILKFIQYSNKTQVYTESELLKKDDFCPYTAVDNATGPGGPGDIATKTTVDLPDIDEKHKILLEKYNELKVKYNLQKPKGVKTLIYCMTNIENNKKFYGSLIMTKDITDVDKHIMKLFIEKANFNEGIKNGPKKYKKSIKNFYKVEHVKEIESENKFETNLHTDLLIEKHNTIGNGLNNKYGNGESGFIYNNAKYDKNKTLTKTHNDRLTYSIQLVLNKIDFMDNYSNNETYAKSNVIFSFKNKKTESGNVYYSPKPIHEYIPTIYNNSKIGFLNIKVNRQSQFSKDLSTHKFADYEIKILETVDPEYTEAQIKQKIHDYKALLCKQKYMQTVITYEKKYNSKEYHKKNYWVNK